MDRAGAEGGQTILDLCTGTGDLAIRFARDDGTGPVWGVDRSREMLRIARRKTSASGLAARIRFVEANALALPFDDESFDVVSIGFGLRNVGQHQRAIGEMTRVLKEGGRLLILEFSPPSNGPFGGVYRFYLGTLLRAVGGVASGSAEAYRHLHTSITAFPKPREIVEILQAERLQDVSFRKLTGGICCIYRGTKGMELRC